MDEGILDLTQMNDDELFDTSLNLNSDDNKTSDVEDTLAFCFQSGADESLLVEIPAFAAQKTSSPVQVQATTDNQDFDDATPRASSPISPVHDTVPDIDESDDERPTNSGVIEFFVRDSPNATPRQRSPTASPIITSSTDIIDASVQNIATARIAVSGVVESTQNVPITSDQLSLESLMADLDMILGDVATPLKTPLKSPSAQVQKKSPVTSIPEPQVQPPVSTLAVLETPRKQAESPEKQQSLLRRSASRLKSPSKRKSAFLGDINELESSSVGDVEARNALDLEERAKALHQTPQKSLAHSSVATSGSIGVGLRRTPSLARSRLPKPSSALTPSATRTRSHTTALNLTQSPIITDQPLPQPVMHQNTSAPASQIPVVKSRIPLPRSSLTRSNTIAARPAMKPIGDNSTAASVSQIDRNQLETMTESSPGRARQLFNRLTSNMKLRSPRVKNPLKQ